MNKRGKLLLARDVLGKEVVVVKRRCSGVGVQIEISELADVDNHSLDGVNPDCAEVDNDEADHSFE